MRFVEPVSDRIDLADGPNGEKNWIEIKRDLNKGEEVAYHSAAARYVFDETAEPELDFNGNPKPRRPKFEVDMKLLPLTMVHAYLVAWSAPDREITLDALRQLEPEDFNEIEDAIKKHVAKRKLEKKAIGGNGSTSGPSASSSTPKAPSALPSTGSSPSPSSIS